MRTPPALRGGFLLRLVGLVVGLFLCSCGIVLFLESELGLPPWDILHQGIAEQGGISFGVANLAVSLALLALAWSLRAPIGLGTLLNAILVGSSVIVLLTLEPVSALSDEGLGVRIWLLPAALVCFGVGSAFYIAAAMGAGPRDSLMLVASQRLGLRIATARTAIEVIVLAIGFALGGTAGLGTLVFAIGIGPTVEVSFWLLGRTPLALTEVASSAA